MVMSDRSQPHVLCRLCGQPVTFLSDTVADEDGKAVHEHCYVDHIGAAPDDRQPESS